MSPMFRKCLLHFPLLVSLTALLTSCTGLQTDGEKAARADAEQVTKLYRPGEAKPVLPDLSSGPAVQEYLRYAMLNQPMVEEAYWEWLASVEKITTERSLPDPKLTFETDITDIVESVMPGLMVDLPGPGKLGARAEVATAESAAKYRAFEAAVLRSAAEFKATYYELYFLDRRLAVMRRALDIARQVERQTRAQLAGGSAYQDALRAQIEREGMETELANLEDQRGPKVERFKAALGIPHNGQVPPLPSTFQASVLPVPADRLLDEVLARNPKLLALKESVKRAEAAIEVAWRERIPDFSVGLEADVKASPVMYRPQAAMTLPIWRDKLAAMLAESQADHRMAQARLSAEQIAMAVEVAEQLYMIREAQRTSKSLAERVVPKAKQALAIARGAYSAGSGMFLDLLEAENRLLAYEMDLVQMELQRERALVMLSLLAADVPSGAPVLTKN